MTDQEIIDNAPEGVTHIDAECDYWRFPESEVWCDVHLSWIYEYGIEMRSLSDIKALIEKDKRIEELEDEIENMGYYIMELNERS